MKRNIVAGVMLLLGGAILRLNSYAISWPKSLSYSGPREATKWAIREAALNDIAMGLFYIGGAILVASLFVSQWKRHVDK